MSLISKAFAPDSIFGRDNLLRHSSARLTLDTYTQSVTPAKRAAQDAVIRLLVTNDQSTLTAPA